MTINLFLEIGAAPSYYSPGLTFLAGRVGAWWEALDVLQMSDTVGGAAVPALNGPVARIGDKSGNNHPLLQPIDANRATYRLSPDGVSYAEFDGVNDHLLATFPLGAVHTRIALIRQITWTSGDRIFDGAAASDTGALIQTNAAAQLSTAAGTGSVGTSMNKVPIGIDTVIIQRFNGAATSVQQDDWPSETINAGTNVPNGLHVGGRSPFNGANSADLLGNFRFYGCIDVEGALTYDEEQAIVAYFTQRMSKVNDIKPLRCIGDSLTAGSGAVNGQFYPQRLQALRGAGWAVFNEGIPTQRSYNGKARCDAGVCTISLTGNQIPASGGVIVTAITPSTGALIDSGPLGYTSFRSYSVNITADNGTIVPGVLSVDNVGGVYTFTRDKPGGALNVSPGAIYHVRQHGRDKWDQIVWFGRNDITNPDAMQNVKAIVDRSLGRSIVHGVTNGWNPAEPTGSTNHNAMLARNAEGLALFGDHFYDIYADLMNTGAGGAWVRQGLTPTTQDLADMSNGLIATTWRGDASLHLGAQAYDAIAKRDDQLMTGFGW